MSPYSCILVILYSISVHVESELSELCLFHNVLTTIQLNLKSLWFEATDHLRIRMRTENC